MSPQIDPVIFDFLRQIAANNNKPWFDANRKFYETARAAFLDFSETFARMVADIDPLVGLQDVKKCVYRINRDVRFSPDKSPYKTHFGVFVAPGGRNSRLPGYYLHLQPGQCMFGTGLYCLTPPELKKLRAEVCAFPEDLHAIVHDPSFTARMRLADYDKLKTLPRGYSIEPQYAELLKYKSLGAEVAYADADVLDADFAQVLASDVELAKPLNTFFRRALEAEPEENADDILGF